MKGKGNKISGNFSTFRYKRFNCIQFLRKKEKGPISIANDPISQEKTDMLAAKGSFEIQGLKCKT